MRVFNNYTKEFEGLRFVAFLNSHFSNKELHELLAESSLSFLIDFLTDDLANNFTDR